MNGVAFASGMLGAIIATVPLEMLLRVLHWREVFGGIVAITVAVSLLIFFAVPERTVARRGESLAEQWRGFARLARDPGFWLAALCIGASQSAAVSLATLWVATWLRDIAGYGPAQVARALLLFALAMLVGYIGFGRAADVLVDIFSIFSVFTFKLNDPQNVRLIPEYGGGCLWDVGVYPLSFSQFIYGDSPKSVYGVQVTSTSGVDEIFIGQLSFSGNRSTQITSSFRSSYQTFVNVIGTKGQMFITRPFSEMDKKQKVILYPERGLPKEISVPKKELYLGQIETMNNAILNGIPPRISLEESRNHIRTVIALYESAKTGMPVLLH